MPTIALSRITKRYPAATTNAVEDMDLTIEHGDFMCMLGPSGCGKTTTLRMIAGLEQPTAGSISVDDRVLDSVDRGVFVPPERREMGLVFQSYALWPHMTIRQNTEYGLRLRKVAQGRARGRRRRRGDDGDGHRAASRTATPRNCRAASSSGWRWPGCWPSTRRCCCSTSHSRTSTHGCVSRCAQSSSGIHRDFGSTIVFVTHDQWEAMTLATRIAVMFEGRLQQIGSPTDIYDRPRQPLRRRVPRQPAHQRRRDRRCRVRAPREQRRTIRQGEDAGHWGRPRFSGVSSGVDPDRKPRRAHRRRGTDHRRHSVRRPRDRGQLDHRSRRR